MRRSPIWSTGLVGLFAAASLALSACAPQATETSVAEPPSVPEAEVIEITMWDIIESEAYVQWWRDYADAFNTSQSAIHVTVEFFDPQAFAPKITSALTAGTAPDIFFTIPDARALGWYAEGRMRSLENLLEADRFVPAARSECTIDGELVCLPLYTAPSYFYYNKALFAQAGVDPQTWADPFQPTWEEFLAAADALLEEGVIPLSLANADGWPGMFYYWAFQNRFGGLAALEGALAGSSSFSTESFLRAGEQVQLLVERGYFPEGFNASGSAQQDANFTQGLAAMEYMGPWIVASIETDAPEGFEFGIFHFPSFSDGDPDAQKDVMAGVDALWISSTSENPDAAAEFLRGFTDAETALSFMLETSSISSIDGAVAVAKERGETAAVVQIAEATSTAPHVYLWWTSLLPPAASDEMLNMSHGLFLLEISPEEFSQRLETAVRE